MKTRNVPLAKRILSRVKAVPRVYSLLLVLLLALVVTGCAPRATAGSWAGITPADDSSLVVANLSRIYYVNSETGALRWEYSGDNGTQFYAPPAVTEDVIFVGSSNGKIFALNPRNGTEVWAEPVEVPGAVIGGLVLADGKIVMGLADRGVVALDQLTGDQEWFFENEQGVWTAPLVVDDMLFVASLDKHIYAINLATGEERWSTSVNGAAGGTPAYADGVLYVGTVGHTVYAIDAASGEILDTAEANGWVWGGPALAEGVLYFGDMSGTLYAIEAATFDPIWQIPLADDGIRGTPLIMDDLIIVGSRDGNVYARTRSTAEPVWQQAAGGEVLSEVIQVSDEMVVVSTLSSENELVALNIESGAIVWRYPGNSE